MNNMKHGSLFSGIGGFDLAATWAGWENVFQVEIDPWCQKILQKHFPNAQRFTDIRDFDGTAWRASVDVISGGFPCQPYSSAGKRLGKDDERHLWPEMLRVIREAAPRWVVGENVRGLVNWSKGLVFEEACADLEASGYEVQPFLLPAASVGAPHQRHRVWFVAHRSGEQVGVAGQSRQHGCVECAVADAKSGYECGCSGKQEGGQAQQLGNSTEPAITSNANSERREKRHASCIASRQGRIGRGVLAQWDDWPTQPPICGRNDGISNRVDSIRGLGNAVVPQLVYRIFDTINAFENGNNKV